MRKDISMVLVERKESIEKEETEYESERENTEKRDEWILENMTAQRYS